MHDITVRAGKLQVDAAASASVMVFQFSTQEDVEKRTEVCARHTRFQIP